MNAAQVALVCYQQQISLQKKGEEQPEEGMQRTPTKAKPTKSHYFSRTTRKNDTIVHFAMGIGQCCSVGRSLEPRFLFCAHEHNESKMKGH